MDAYFYDYEGNILGYMSSIKKQEIEFIKKHGIETEGKIYEIYTVRYNIDRTCVVFRCKK